ncbi:hypothetical protein GCM10023259_045280 [Thermocatellispora tengchongensis]
MTAGARLAPPSTIAVAMTMARMKAATLRHALRGQRAGLVTSGGALGLALAGGTVFLAVRGLPGGADADLLAAAYAVWMFGWILGPVFAGGGDETLRPEHFASLGIPPRRLAAGLLAAAFTGVAPVISLLALAGLVVHGARQGAAAALVAVPAAAMTLAVFVLLSKVAVAALGLALRSRLGAVAAGVVNGAILAFLGQGWVFAVAFGQGARMPSGVVRALPSGWGLVATEAAAAGRWAHAAGVLAGTAVLIAVLLAVWAALLTRRLGAPRASTRGRRPMRATTGTGVVLAKELRTWSRDLARTHQLTFALAYGLCFAGAPLVLGWSGMLPWAGPLAVLMAAAMSANLYGGDGTALWLTLMSPGARDVRGRQLAWLLTVAPVALVVTVAGAALAGGPWALPLAVLAAALGGGAGLVVLVSVYGLVPGVDPHRRGGNPLRVSEDDGAITGTAYLMLVLAALTAVPAGLVALRHGWAGVPVGLVTGALFAWGFGLLAERRLRAYGPELLHIMRTGRRPSGGSAGGLSSSLSELPAGQRAVVMVCMSLGAIPLVPQGIVAGALLSGGASEQSWFLALYMPPDLRWPTVAFMVLLGAGMYATGLTIFLRARRAARGGAA